MVKNSIHIVLVIAILIMASCTIKKVMSVKIYNKNDYPISFTISVGNIQKSYTHIQAQQTLTEQLDWTNIEKKDGEFNIVIENETTHESNTFKHGSFMNGELGNYFDATCKDDQVQITVSD